MENMPLVSIVVPVYKVEAYLDKCISSIVEQTYTNLEIILVDDGSPDNCPAMCDAWAAKDSRIKVIHKENGGLSDARNAGMQIAAGEYIGFVDSDDYISPEMYQLLFDNMQDNNADIAACGVEMVFEDGAPSRMLTPPGCHVLDNQQSMAAIIREDLLKQPVWYKLYRTVLIRDIPFAVEKCHEDVFWSWQAIARAKKVSIFDTPCYYYLQRSDSIMGEKFSEKRLDSIEAKCQRYAFIESHHPELAPDDLCNLHFSCLYLGQRALRMLSKPEALPVLNRLKHTIAAHAIDAEVLRHRKLSHKIWLWLSQRAFRPTCLLRNILRVGL